MPDTSKSTEASPRLIPGGLAVAPPPSLRPSADHQSDRTDLAQPSRMGKGPGISLASLRRSTDVRVSNRTIHPSWLALIELCGELGHGEIERLSIQDGLPVLAETVKKKVRFTR